MNHENSKNWLSEGAVKRKALASKLNNETLAVILRLNHSPKDVSPHDYYLDIIKSTREAHKLECLLKGIEPNFKWGNYG